MFIWDGNKVFSIDFNGAMVRGIVAKLDLLPLLKFVERRNLNLNVIWNHWFLGNLEKNISKKNFLSKNS